MGFLKFFRVMFNMMFLRVDWATGTSAVTGAINAGMNIYGTIQGVKSAREQLKVAKEQLAETKKMNQWEVDKYNKALENQTSAIETLGNAFANFGNTSADIKAKADNATQGAVDLSADNANNPQNNTESSQNTQEKEHPLPTERY